MNQILRYRNELIVVLTLLLMFGVLGYRNGKIAQGTQSGGEAMQTLAQFDETVSLRGIWGDKALAQKVQTLKLAVPPSKVSWMQKNTKVTATYKELTATELNDVGKKLLNMGVQIERFEIRRNNEMYEVELVCKW